MLNRMIRDIGHYIKKLKFKDLWRKKNKNNFTIANEIFNINKVTVGQGTYANLNVHCYGNNKEKLIIGNYCSISDDVHFILGGNHRYDLLSSYPIKNKLINGECEAYTKGPIIIEDDVWIGYGCKILSGVTIGRGAVIGAGSIVTKDVPPYSIYAGNEIKKFRFSKDIIEELKKIDYKMINIDEITKKINLFYTKIDRDNIKQIVKEVNKR